VDGLMWVLMPDGIYLLRVSLIHPPETLLYLPDSEALRIFATKTVEFQGKLAPPIPSAFKKAFDEAG
jgi:hypothetical protein